MKKPLVLALALALAACNPTTTATTPPPDAGPQISAAIEAQDAAFNQALAAKDAAAVAGFYAPDAQMFNSGQPPATTHEAILAAYTGLLTDPNGSLSIRGDDVINPSSGDFAFAQGAYTISYTDPTTHHKVSETGAYMTLWRHQDDGSWKIMRDIAASAPPSAPAPTAQH